MCMIEPDAALVADVLLLSLGFEEGNGLGKKIAGAFSVLSDLLERHGHYHFGLRMVIAALTRAGRVKREAIEVGLFSWIVSSRAWGGAWRRRRGGGAPLSSFRLLLLLFCSCAGREVADGLLESSWRKEDDVGRRDLSRREPRLTEKSSILLQGEDEDELEGQEEEQIVVRSIFAVANPMLVGVKDSSVFRGVIADYFGVDASEISMDGGGDSGLFMLGSICFSAFSLFLFLFLFLFFFFFFFLYLSLPAPSLPIAFLPPFFPSHTHTVSPTPPPQQGKTGFETCNRPCAAFAAAKDNGKTERSLPSRVANLSRHQSSHGQRRSACSSYRLRESAWSRPSGHGEQWGRSSQRPQSQRHKERSRLSCPRRTFAKRCCRCTRRCV